MEITFGFEATRIVLAVTNPWPVPGATRAEKNAQYVEHVQRVINLDPEVYVKKLVDFVDNACGLPHNNVEGNEGLVARLAAKYRPLVAIFQAELSANPRIADLVSAEGLASIKSHLDGATARLAVLV